MKINKLKNRNGFTLIELLLYASLAAVVLGVIASFYGLLIDGKIKQQTINEVEQQGQFVLREIAQAIRNAEAVTSPGAGSSSSVLVLDMYDSGVDATTFDLSSGVVRVCEGGDCSPVDLTASNVVVSDLTFQNLSRNATPGVVRIQFDVALNGTDRNPYNYNRSYVTTAALRSP